MKKTINKIINYIASLIDIKIQRIKLRIFAGVAHILSSLISLFIIVSFTLFFLFFLSFALAEIINTFFDSTYIGFLIISGTYFSVILGVILLVRTKKLQGWIEALIMKIREKKT